MDKKKFRVRDNSSEEAKIRRRAIIFGVLTIVLGLLLIVWGIPLFIKLIGILADIKTQNEEVIDQDVIPPPVPRLLSVLEATNSAQLPISGFTEPGARVKIKLNDEEIETRADADGKFSIGKLMLRKGENRITAVAIDEANNQSETSEENIIVYDDQPPDLEIEAPKGGEIVEEGNIEIKGKTEPKARVLVNDYIVVVDESGKFSTKILLKEGGNRIVVTAQDKAGNKTEKEITLTYLP